MQQLETPLHASQGAKLAHDITDTLHTVIGVPEAYDGCQTADVNTAV